MRSSHPYIKILSPLLAIQLSSSMAFGQVYSGADMLFVGSQARLSVPGDFNNQGVAKIEGELTVGGDLDNQSVLTNNGSIRLEGDWTNQQIYNEGTGSIMLEGRDQVFDHNDQTVHSLVLSGSGDKTLTSEVIVSGVLELNEGIIRFDGPGQLRLLSTADVEGASTLSYVSGPMTYEGPGYRFFPIGKSGGYRPVILEDIRGIDPVIELEMFQPNPYGEHEFDLEEVSPTRYWQMDVGGTLFEGSIITLALADDGLADQVEKLVVAEAPAGGEAFINLGRSRIDASAGVVGTITSEFPATGGIYALALLSETQPSDLLFVPNTMYPASLNSEDRAARVYGARLSSDNFLFTVYNRWGNVVFETRSLEVATQTGWDGTNQSGTEQSPGSFKYVLSGSFTNGQSFSKVGSITLIR